MDLGTFHKLVSEQKTKRTSTGTGAGSVTKRSGASLADRLRSKDQKDDKPSVRLRGVSTLVKRQSEYVESGADFPILAEVRSLPALGDWSKGIETIVAAKDLPDPAIAERALKNARRNAERAAKRPYANHPEFEDEYYDECYDTSPGYSDSEEENYVPVQVSVVSRKAAPVESLGVDDVDWKEI